MSHRPSRTALALFLCLTATTPSGAIAQDAETVVTFVGPVGAAADQAFLVEVGELRWKVGPLAGAGSVRFPIEQTASVHMRRLEDCSVWVSFTVAPGSHTVVTRERGRVVVAAGDVPGAVVIGDASSPPVARCVRLVAPVSPAPSVAPEIGPCAEDIELDALRAIPRAWVDALWRFYAAGVADFDGLVTDAALDQVRSLDWRFRAVEAGTGLFAEDASVTLATSAVGCALRADGARTVADLEVAIDVAPGAAVIDPATGRILEEHAGRQRRVVAWTLERATAGAPWMLVGAGLPLDLEPELPIAIVGEPCPRGRAGRASGAANRRGDPFLAQPWCDAGGDGHVVPWGDAVYVSRGLCHKDGRTPHRMWLGEPAGALRDVVSDDRRPFVRDPHGLLRPEFAKGFDRDARLPADAVSTGLSNGRVTIWTAASDGPDAIYLRLRGGRVERWPRAPYELACG